MANTNDVTTRTNQGGRSLERPPNAMPVGSESTAGEGADRPEHRYLARWPRAGAWLVDFAVATPAITTAFIIVHALLPLFGVERPLEAWQNGELSLHGTLMAVSFIYHAVMIKLCGGTLGHLAVGGQIVHHRTGKRISLARSTSRAALGSLDLLYVPMLVNAVFVLARRDHRHLYDLLAGTVAVRKETSPKTTGDEPRRHSDDPDHRQMSSAHPAPAGAGGEK